MREEDEKELHKKIQKVEGRYEVKTDWGEMIVTLRAVPNYAGGKGCPDEILTLAVVLPVLGTHVELAAPILIEAEKAGHSAALADLEKFCDRSVSGEQRSYLNIPMIVVGGQDYRKPKPVERQLKARFNITQVPREIAL